MGHPSSAVEGVKRKEAENCKFFPNCANPDCPYKQYFPLMLDKANVNSPAVSVSKALSIPCKFGVNCTRPNCIYNHEIAIPCRYRPCLNEQCLFKHTEGQQPNKNKVWTSDSNGSTMDRKFAYDNAEERIVVGSGLHGQGGDTIVHE
jgi:nuclear polyadenylated RNA-binding protein NAB2